MARQSLVPPAVLYCLGVSVSFLLPKMADQHDERTRNGQKESQMNSALESNSGLSMDSMDKNNKKLTVSVELEGGSSISAMELMKYVRQLCGGLVACRVVGHNRYEMTMSHPKGKERLLEGFKMGETRIHARELCNNELVVSFLNLPFYIEDCEIHAKLSSWGVSAASPIKRRMWPGTNVADGTRFLKVKFNDHVQSLPYSTKFSTALGAEYFRVIHDKQMKVCRMCIQPGHIMRECPEFQCHKCGVQGHFARECKKNKNKCSLCYNSMEECICNQSESESIMIDNETIESGEDNNGTSGDESVIGEEGVESKLEKEGDKELSEEDDEVRGETGKMGGAGLHKSTKEDTRRENSEESVPASTSEKGGRTLSGQCVPSDQEAPTRNLELPMATDSLPARQPDKRLHSDSDDPHPKTDPDMDFEKAKVLRNRAEERKAKVMAKKKLKNKNN